MDMNEIIQVVQDKAVEIAEQEIAKYNKDFPELNLTEKAKDAVRVRATSQLTLQLSKFRFHKDDEEFKDHFNQWFNANEEDDLKLTDSEYQEKMCKGILYGIIAYFENS